MLDRQWRSFVAEGPPTAAVRRNRIDRLMALLLDNSDAFIDAMAADYGTRSKAASLFTEIIGITSVVEHTRSHVAQWMRPAKLMPAARVLSAVPDCGLPGAQVVGVPVREAITSLDRPALRAEARRHFGFADDARVLLVFGGSQGAASLNRAVSGAAAGLAAAGVAVLHAHGPKNTLDLREPGPGDPPYVAVPYLDRMDLAYAAADLVICRSGAMTVAEVSAVGLPAIYVPLPIGNGEQRLNALPVVNAGGGMVVADADLTPELVAREVAALVGDPPRLAAMTTAAARVGHPDAARQVAQAALDIARKAQLGRLSAGGKP